MYDSVCKCPVDWQRIKPNDQDAWTRAKVQMTAGIPGDEAGDTLAVTTDVDQHSGTRETTA